MPKLDELNGIYIGSTEIQKVYLGNQEIWANEVPIDVPPTRYLTFTSTGGNTLSMRSYNGNAPVMWYSLNGTDWFVWKYSNLNIASGSSVYIAGSNPNGVNTLNTTYSRFYITGNGTVACTGSVMSLINPYQDVLTIPNNYCFNRLFIYCEKLTSAPSLPATTLSSRCYDNMFNGCILLSSAPSLPATTLANACYYQMFAGCTSLTTAPNLPAATLVTYCYAYMFNGCSNINYIKCLATSLTSYDTTYSWAANVASTGTFVKAAGVNWSNGPGGIPANWTVVQQ